MDMAMKLVIGFWVISVSAGAANALVAFGGDGESDVGKVGLGCFGTQILLALLLIGGGAFFHEPVTAAPGIHGLGGMLVVGELIAFFANCLFGMLCFAKGLAG
jgi:hypothetical protein